MSVIAVFGEEIDQILASSVSTGATWYGAAVTAADLPAATVLYTLRHSWITTALTSGMGTLDVAR